MLRVLVLRLRDDEHILVMTLHHIACDGWSIGRIVLEVEELYGAAVRNTAPTLPALPLRYRDHADRERAELALPAAEEHLTHWLERLRGDLPILALTSDRPRPPVQTHQAGSFRFPVPAELLAEVGRASRDAAVTPFMTLLASYAATLARSAGQDEVVVGTATANRPRADLEPLVGPFVNTLALRLGVDTAAPFTALQAEVKRVAVDTLAHQDVPFQKVVEAVNPPRDLSRSPIFQTMFVLQNMPIPRLRLTGLEVEPMPIDVETLEVDLSLELLDLPSGMIATFRFNRQLFDASSIERLAGHWLTLLTSAVARPEVRVGELEWLPVGERVALEGRWWGRVTPETAEVCVHSMVERQVAATPDRVAVRFGGESLTYAELDARANRLAHHLIDGGVRAGDLVAVHLERSLEMVVGVLGVLKAGAGYVPIDPRLPEARIAFHVGGHRSASCGDDVGRAKGLPGSGGDGGPRLVLVDVDAALIAAQPARRRLVSG